jgi:hypothetical protein
MSAAEYLHCTPPEINIKIEAWNDARRAEAQRDYRFLVAHLTGYHDPKKFPSFERFYPETDLEPVEQKLDKQLADAMEIARQLGHI